MSERVSVAFGQIFGASAWLREQGLPDSATHLEDATAILRTELETLSIALQQIAYALWGDTPAHDVVAELQEIARRALGEVQ